MARGNEIDSHSTRLFAKSRSCTYPRFCLFALLPSGNKYTFYLYASNLSMEAHAWEHIDTLIVADNYPYKGFVDVLLTALVIRFT